MKKRCQGQGMIVHCLHHKLVDIATLKPNPANPNRHPDSQVELLARILKTQGWRSPIVVSKRSDYIVKGHGRLAAARLAGFKQVPVEYQPYESEEMEMADLLADNRISELAELDMTMVKDIIGSIDTGLIDLALTGFDESTIADMIAGCEYPPEESEPEEDDDPTPVKCPKCGFRLDEK